MMEQKNKKKKGSGAAAAVVLVLALLGNLAEETGAIVLVPVLVLAVMGGVLGLVLGKKYKRPVPVFKKKEPCDYGKVNHEYSHDVQRRLTQLDGFYRDGLIDRSEYELLLRRWSE